MASSSEILRLTSIVKNAPDLDMRCLSAKNVLEEVSYNKNEESKQFVYAKERVIGKYWTIIIYFLSD